MHVQSQSQSIGDCSVTYKTVIRKFQIRICIVRNIFIWIYQFTPDYSILHRFPHFSNFVFFLSRKKSIFFAIWVSSVVAVNNQFSSLSKKNTMWLWIVNLCIRTDAISIPFDNFVKFSTFSYPDKEQERKKKYYFDELNLLPTNQWYQGRHSFHSIQINWIESSRIESFQFYVRERLLNRWIRLEKWKINF